MTTERLNDRLVQSKYATDIGSTDAANLQYGDVCEVFDFDLYDPAFQEYWYTPEGMSNAKASLSVTPAFKPKRVNKEHPHKIYIIS